MGMAASQARFLGLTARKNNVEYEGQQINQQRTTLSNESANYYNDLLGMSVPVPPSVDDYTKTVYTFQDGALTNQITAMIVQNGVDEDGNSLAGTYKISYLRQWVDDFAVVSACTSIVNNSGDKDDGPFMVGANQLRTLGEVDTSTSEKETGNYTYNGEVLKEAGELELDEDGTDDSGNEVTATIYKDSANNEYFMYKTDDGEEAWYEIATTSDPSDIEGEEYAVLLEGDIPEKETKEVAAYDVDDDEYLKNSHAEYENLSILKGKVIKPNIDYSGTSEISNDNIDNKRNNADYLNLRTNTNEQNLNKESPTLKDNTPLIIEISKNTNQRKETENSKEEGNPDEVEINTKFNN